MKQVLIVAFFLWAVFGCQTSGRNTDLLRAEIQQIVADKKAVVGVSIIANDGKDTLSLNGDRRCPLQSVFKLHIGLAVLSQVDKGRFTLDQTVEVRKADLVPDLWSPLRDENPNGGLFTIARLIQYAVSQSDNVACDVLIRLLGSPKAVETYIKENGVEEIAIRFAEKEMQAEWDNMFQNWTTPKAASKTLQIFYDPAGKRLSKRSYDFIWQTLRETGTGVNRLKGRLPAGTVVAHKTGSSGTNKEGLTAATNDIGLLFLPNGEFVIISVFVTDSKENEATNEKLIADIAKATYDFYTNPAK
ncbi:class A beta-lactamase, subclass A2 [Rudanella paleaurantiibacter]|uniref:beta-lactamase n=1 Tax=Rudanella paleaurantiibacter TaxID=2614655 RepID=A0A7J5U044_9BACT|nr:class A beta-lactamase, subclass A2 [Rudanella paleaurantiibacter]KAB7731070.1 class A beta-lactamase, subclass A2 [Rudanella paleaurantiibacter]